MKLNRINIILIITVVFIAVYSTLPSKEVKQNVEETNIRELVNNLSTGNTTDQFASIRPNELIVVDKDDNEKTYDISNEDFFVSFAPYINQTHP